MNYQEHKNKIKSLSVCSIPVMLAVVSWSTASTAPVMSDTANYCVDVPATVAKDQAPMRTYKASAQANANWICVSPDKQYFYDYELLEQMVSPEIEELTTNDASDSADLWVDLDVSDDDQYLYQTFGHTGTIAVYEIDGKTLSLAEVLSA